MQCLSLCAWLILVFSHSPCLGSERWCQMLRFSERITVGVGKTHCSENVHKPYNTTGTRMWSSLSPRGRCLDGPLTPVRITEKTWLWILLNLWALAWSCWSHQIQFFVKNKKGEVLGICIHSIILFISWSIVHGLLADMLLKQIESTLSEVKASV